MLKKSAEFVLAHWEKIISALATVGAFISGFPEKARWGMIGFALGILTSWLGGLAVQKWKNRPTVALQNCADKIAALRKATHQIFYEQHFKEDVWRPFLLVWEPIHQKALVFNEVPTARDALELKSMYCALCKAAALLKCK